MNYQIVVDILTDLEVRASERKTGRQFHNFSGRENVEGHGIYEWQILLQ